MLKLRIHNHHYLRELVSDDVAALFCLIDTNRDYLSKQLWWLDDIQNIKDCAAYLYQKRQNGVTLGIFYYDKLVGFIEIKRIILSFRSAVLGYWIAASAQGKGIMTASCKRILRYLFDEKHFHRVEANVVVGNKKSIRLLERLGFVLEGRKRKTVWMHGNFFDNFHYSILEDEWQQQKKSTPIT